MTNLRKYVAIFAFGVALYAGVAKADDMPASLLLPLVEAGLPAGSDLVAANLQGLASAVAAAVAEAPELAPAMVKAVVMVRPEAAAEIAAAAAVAAPAFAVQIAESAVQAAPDSALAITTAMTSALPSQAAAIEQAVLAQVALVLAGTAPAAGPTMALPMPLSIGRGEFGSPN